MGTEADWLQGLKEGDLVIVRGGAAIINYRQAKVTRVTATQIHTLASKFRRDTGYAMGQGSSYGRSRLVQADESVIEKMDRDEVAVLLWKVGRELDKVSIEKLRQIREILTRNDG